MRARGLSILVLFALAFLVVSCGLGTEHLPTPTGVAPGLNVPTVAPGVTPQPALLERRLLVLNWPKTIRERDSELIVLTIEVDENGTITPTVSAPGKNGEGTPVDIPNLYDTHTILAVARLDLAGMEAYRENIREPLMPGKPAVFRWSVRAGEAGIYRGVVWLHLELVPKSGGPVNETLLMARPIEIQAVTVLGMPGDAARILGGIGIFASTLLGYPFVQRWLEPWLKKWEQRNSARAKAGKKKSPLEEVRKK